MWLAVVLVETCQSFLAAVPCLLSRSVHCLGPGSVVDVAVFATIVMVVVAAVVV